MGAGGFWSDTDRRRAAALSLLVHAAALLALVVWIDLDLPEAPTPERFLVIELGSPAPAEAETPAPADDAPAADAPLPAVASDAPGRPAPGRPEDVTGGEPAAENVPAPETPAPPSPPAQDVAEPEAVETPVAATPVQVPTPSVRTPEAAEPAPAPEIAASVPEIDTPDLAPRPLADRVPVPLPSTEPTGGAIALPEAAPDARAEARSLPPLRAEVDTRQARGVPVPEPVTVQTARRAVETPTPAAGVPDGRTLPTPSVRAVAGTSRALGVSPRAGVRAVRTLPTPSVQAAVRPAPVEEGPGAAADVPAPDAPVGGDAARPGQPGGPEDAPLGALGRAGSPEGRAGDGGSPARPPPPLRETRPRPLGVLIDNVAGYPQSGLPQASWIAEMPVEGGQTRLMAMFDAGEPARVGPVRSARDYFVEMAGRADAVLVHDGGSPSALLRLEEGVAPSLNAFQRGELFQRAQGRSAPYNLYTEGPALRDAIRRMNIDAQRLLTGFRPVPPGDEVQRADGVNIDWSGAYDSAFRYVPGQDRYRWIRQGEDAVDASGTAVQVDAVLLGRVEAREIPQDPAGRLYVAVEGGPATLLWRGTVQHGRWSVNGGLRFVANDGTEVSLEAMMTWAAFLPPWAEATLR
jgi:hypothetical protein